MISQLFFYSTGNYFIFTLDLARMWLGADLDGMKARCLP